ncbi:MAG: hypothetical protein P4L77_12015 [Sulfuriferula sp.]|nr:hypothetical protein [Sulfuriferula sp.]
MSVFDYVQPTSVPASVPAAAPPAGGGGLDLQSLIQNIVKPIDPKLIESATSLIPGSHAQNVPSSLTTPIAPHQDRPMDTRQVVGRKNAMRQGISNAFTGATNALGAIVNKETQIKQNQIKDAATKVIMAQQAIDEAKQAHDAAVANNDTATVSKMQEVMQQNQQARDGIFADPKMRKALQKGFDISYTDPQSNKTEEHAAVQAALAQAKTFAEKREIMKQQQAKQNQTAGAAMGAAFEKSQPQGVGPNVQAIQKVQLQQATQKLQLQAQKDLMSFQASIYKSDRSVDAARVREIGAGILQTQRLAFQENQMQQRFAQAEHLMGERFTQQVKLVGIRGAEARKVANEIYTDKESDPLTLYNKNRTAAETYQKNSIADGKALVELQAQRMAMYVDSKGNPLKVQPNPADVHSLDMQIELVKSALANDDANAKNFAQQANRLHDTFGLDERVATDGYSGTGSRSESDATGDTDYSDPIGLLNDDSEDQ